MTTTITHVNQTVHHLIYYTLFSPQNNKVFAILPTSTPSPLVLYDKKKRPYRKLHGQVLPSWLYRHQLAIAIALVHLIAQKNRRVLANSGTVENLVQDVVVVAFKISRGNRSVKTLRKMLLVSIDNVHEVTNGKCLVIGVGHLQISLWLWLELSFSVTGHTIHHIWSLSRRKDDFLWIFSHGQQKYIEWMVKQVSTRTTKSRVEFLHTASVLLQTQSTNLHHIHNHTDIPIIVPCTKFSFFLIPCIHPALFQIFSVDFTVTVLRVVIDEILLHCASSLLGCVVG